MRVFPFLFSLMLLLTANTTWALQEPGQDLPFLGRYPGSVMDAYKTSQFDEVAIPLGPLGKNGPARSETIQGKVTYIRYKMPEGRSALEIANNYQQALQQAGFRTLWQCANNACRASPDAPFSMMLWPGAPTRNTNHDEPFAFFQSGGRAITAEHRAADGVRTVAFIDINSYDKDISVYAVQTVPMQSGMVTSDAGQLTRQNMASALVRQGRFAMRLPFDFNQATLRPDALPTVVELARLMQQYPALRVRLEGHTDRVGTDAYNHKLSLGRAQAVKAALLAQGITGQRIEVAAFGATRPVASNDTDAGRAQNRRVEVVDLTPGVISAVTPSPAGVTPAMAAAPSMNGMPAMGGNSRATPRNTGTPSANIPGSELAGTAADAVRDETNYQVSQGVRGLVRGLFGN